MNNDEVMMLKKVALACTAATCIYAYQIKGDAAEPAQADTVIEATVTPTATPTATKIPATPKPTATVKPTEKPAGVKRAEETEKSLKPWPDCKLGAKLQAYVISVAKAYELDENIVMAVIERESDFNQNCMGDNNNSFGLMQIWRNQHMDRIEKLLGTTSKDSLRDPYNNILVGCDILSECYKANGKLWHRALMSYNGGQGYCNKRLKQGLTSSNYSEWVIERSKYYDKTRRE